LTISSPAALVTGGSRGIGAATVLALVERGFDVAFTYRSKKRRAEQVVVDASKSGRRVLAVASDMTDEPATLGMLEVLRRWTERLDVLVLNASGGLERELVAADPNYPMRMNRDAQLALVKGARPLMDAGGTIVFVTSHWAHLYGRVEQLPAYQPVASSKHAGEQALREMLAGRDDRIRLLVVTGDLVEGTVTPKLLERVSRGVRDQHRQVMESLPTATDMGEAIAAAVVNHELPSGHTVVVGRSLQSLIVS
jgi:NAD(P)-dependent dehydrogenase (short-subunit alcohol dehydrogenase family)